MVNPPFVSLTELSRRRASRLQLRSPPKPGGQGQEALQRTAGDRDVLHDALPAGAPIRYDWAGGVGITGAPAFCGNGALVIAGELVGRLCSILAAFAPICVCFSPFYAVEEVVCQKWTMKSAR